jgi:hypothetical protein
VAADNPFRSPFPFAPFPVRPPFPFVPLSRFAYPMEMTHVRGKQIGIFLVVSLMVAGIGPHARADLLGTSVTGFAQFGGNPNNYFDPANGFVPSGYENTAALGVTISGSQTEFGYQDANVLITADFTGTQLTIIEHFYKAAGDFSNQHFSFRDTAFGNGTWAATGTDSFSGGLAFSTAQSGDLITAVWGGGGATAGTTWTAVYTFTPTITAVPEPPTLWVAAVGGAGFAGYGWRRARRTRAAAWAGQTWKTPVSGGVASRFLVTALMPIVRQGQGSRNGENLQSP